MTTPTRAVDPRDLWRAFEPVHAVVYFAPETRDIYAEAGLKGSWMGYFASRSAAMGAVGAETVIATFHNFAPTMVRRAIPDAWRFSSPERVLGARLRIADLVLRRLLGDAADGAAVEEAAELAGRAVRGIAAQLGGRPLFAAHAGLPEARSPLLALWQACGSLREHRFDGHVAVLTAHDVGGLEALILHAAGGRTPRSVLQPFRGWTDQQWEAAEARLRERGLIDGDAALTADGRVLSAGVERRTDELAQAQVAALDGAAARFLELLAPFDERIRAGGGIPPISPLGLN